ncbi:RES domain-containing protein [Sinirhodobacter populi]|uniref:RES domain-containing protein n=2 Tax=Paenirhodobacter populi TaxID=2306993 RepID=A0A443J912_9RHOB|nr:RES domain-containing protein [Sinirhodobacter populi]
MRTQLPSGAELHRIHNQAHGPCEFNGTNLGSARFSPIKDLHGKIIPTIYAAESFKCAACEIILRAPDAVSDPSALTVVSPQDYQSYQHSVVRSRRALDLVDLTAFGQRAIGLIGNALLAGGTLHYQTTRAWAEAIHAYIPWAAGIYYTSYQAGPEFALILFGDRCSDALEETAPARPIRAPSVEDEIRDIGKAIGIEYADI